MPKPTKFDLMRLGRERVSTAPNRRSNALADWMTWAGVERPNAPPAALAVPTMEVDGVLYRSVQEADEAACDGCAFLGQGRCIEISNKGGSLLGADCYDVPVIYLRAEG